MHGQEVNQGFIFISYFKKNHPDYNNAQEVLDMAISVFLIKNSAVSNGNFDLNRRFNLSGLIPMNFDVHMGNLELEKNLQNRRVCCSRLIP